MIKVTLEFNDVGETLDALFKLYGSAPRATPGGVSRQIDSDITDGDIIDVVAQPVNEKGNVVPLAPAKRRGRPPKNVAAPATTGPGQEAPAPAATSAATPVAAAPVTVVEPLTPGPKNPEAAGPSQSDALVALEKLFSKKGMVVAEQTLARYKATKLRELDRKHYAAFVKDCHDQVNA